jgi:GAF domain-containing protein
MEIRGIFGRVLKDGNSLIANEPGTHPDRVGLPSGHPELTAFLGVPLRQDGRTIGMVALGNKPSGYSEHDREAIEALSVAFVEALQRKRADDRVRDQLEELQRWQEVMLGREDRVQELKGEVNELCRCQGEPPRYPSQEADSADSEKKEP